MNSPLQSRRTFLARSSAAVAGAMMAARESALGAAGTGPFQAMGTRTGEMTDTTAIIWTRLTRNPVRNNAGVAATLRKKGEKKEKNKAAANVPADQLEGACSGAPGRVRVRYGTREDLSDALTTEPAVATAESDFITHFPLRNLKPGTVYHYVSEIPGAAGTPAETSVRGRFETAPAKDAPGNLRFCVMTCQAYGDRGHADGHPIYPAMLALKPQFTCLTGDLVYYDNDPPNAKTVAFARHHWERMFSLPRLVEFTRQNGTYWLKDDHDTLTNDTWPGTRAGELTFEQGQEIFRQQAPIGSGPGYRTIRWGRDLQVWFAEGRDFRSPNTTPDGPEKTIWGAAQKEWFKRTVKESDATWKVLVSPTPLVGPDRASGKNDNHSNAGFSHEGNELRRWLRENAHDQFFVICGDRHWQYHSVHPETGVQEFSVGPASDEHAGGTPGEDPRIHRFHRVKGGFLSVTLRAQGAKSAILFEHRDVDGKVVYSWQAERAA